VAALGIAVIALGLAALRFLVPGDARCQTAAWDTQPADGDLPAGWMISATQYDLSRKTMSLLGPAPLDETGSQAVVYATVTCFAQGAGDSVSRSAQAATDAGQSVSDRDDLGDQGFSATDDSGAAFLQFRHGDLVVYLAASGDATPPEVDQIASAFDIALGGDGGTSATPGPTDAAVAPSDDAVSPGPSDATAESPAAPELEAALPTRVGDLSLVTDSATGSMILGDDEDGRAIVAALKAIGKDADAFRIAQAYDEANAADLLLIAVGVDGMPLDAVRKLVVDSWLAASGAGVTQAPVKLGETEWTRIDYGDGGAADYVRGDGSIVYVITTSDPALAAQAAAAIP